ncbi:MAG: nitrilase family protein [Peptococcaceae bacterium]|nr:nitrilase family protein [Peptococcaceae bacterium]
MEKTRIALVQMQSKIGMIEENMKKIEQFVSEAARKKVDIICFPELCVQGYNREKAHLTAVDIPGEIPDAVSAMARRAGLVALVGVAEKSESGRPYITHLAVFPDGSLQKYRKTHLGKSEVPYFTPGDEFVVFSCGKARFSVQICWDLHFPEMSTILSLRGTEIIFAPHASPTVVGDRREIWLKYLAARAYDNAVFVAACNLVGDSGCGQSFCGGALVIDPKGNVVAEAFNGREEMLVVNLDPVLINTIRNKEARSMRNSFYLDCRRPELYGELVKKREEPA